MDSSKILKVRVNCNLKTAERIYPAGEISAPFQDDLLAELASGSGAVEVVAEVAEVFEPQTQPQQVPAPASQAGAGERDELTELAERIGVVVDKRWGTKKLRAEIERAMAARRGDATEEFSDV